MTDPVPGGDAPPGLDEKIERALQAALRMDNERLRDAMRAIADESFPAGLGYACYVWARVAASAILGTPQQLLDYNAAATGGVAAGVQFLIDGEVVNAEDADPASRFIGRMVACAFNNDVQAAIDVFATIEDGAVADCAVGMVRFAAGTVVRRTLTDLGGSPGAVP